jgi:uncharacterized protein YgbK (DUF1537 family)
MIELGLITDDLTGGIYVASLLKRGGVRSSSTRQVKTNMAKVSDGI